MAVLVIIYLLYKINELEKDIKEKDVMYVDTSGISENPMINFIDVWKGKTINFQLDKYIVHIAHLPALTCIRYIENIAYFYTLLKDNLEYKSTGRIDKIKNEAAYLNTYNSIVELVYKLSKQFVNNKSGYRKALRNKSKNDIVFMCEICEQILNYWTYVKKKIQILGKGTTLQQMAGGQLSWDSLNLDGNGTISLKPRFVPLSNIQRN